MSENRTIDWQEAVCEICGVGLGFKTQEDWNVPVVYSCMKCSGICGVEVDSSPIPPIEEELLEESEKRFNCVLEYMKDEMNNLGVLPFVKIDEALLRSALRYSTARNSGYDRERALEFSKL